MDNVLSCCFVKNKTCQVVGWYRSDKAVKVLCCIMLSSVIHVKIKLYMC